MLTETAIPVAASTPVESSFVVGVVAGLAGGAALMYAVWHWLLQL